jgi:hypothetical protein
MGFRELLNSPTPSEWGLATGFLKVEPGDIIWVYFAHPESAIRGLGRVRSGPRWHNEWGRYSVLIEWDRGLTEKLGSNPIPFRAYGQRVQGAVNEANADSMTVLLKWLRTHQVPAQRSRDIEIAFRSREIRERTGQQEFRLQLLKAYDNRCCITGCDVIEVLEAAHIASVAGGGGHSVKNGLLLRADLHALFDRGLITIADDFTVIVHRSLRHSIYQALDGRNISVPTARSGRPTLGAIRAHRELAPK